MKLKTTFILLIVAAIGIAYVFFYEKKQLPHEEWVKLQRKVFPYFKSSMVKKIELNNEKGNIVLEKSEDGFWYIVEPQRLRADNSEINSILSEFEFMNKVGSFKKEGDSPFNLADYGLVNPPTVITMYTNIPTSPDKIRITGPRESYTVVLGEKLAAGDNVYIKLDEQDDEVIVVPGAIKSKLEKGVLDLRSKWVFWFDKEAVDTLSIKTDEFNIVCNKQGEFWRLTEPIDDLADNQKIKDMLSKLRDIEIDREDFLTEESPDLVRYGLDTPRYTVTIQERGKTQSVILGHSLDNKVYAKRTDEPTIFLLKDTILIDLNKKPNDLRDRRLVRFESIKTYGIDKVEIKTPDDVVTIEKALDLDWKLTSPVKIYADQNEVKNFIEKIKTIEIEDFVSDEPQDLSQYGLEKPVFEVSVTKEEDKELAKFYVGYKLPGAAKCYVKRINEKPVYTVPTAGFYDKMEHALLNFRDKLVCDFDKDLAKEIVIEKPDRTFVCKKTDEKGELGLFKWRLEKPVPVMADTDAINQIVWDLSFLKADKYVEEAPEDLGAYGLDDPRIRISVTYEKEIKQPPENEGEKSEVGMKPKEPLSKLVETRTLLIGNAVGEGDMANSYCMFTDSDFVFELPWPTVRNFNTELVPTKVAKFERINVDTISLKYDGGENIRLEKVNNRWQFVDPEKENIVGREVDYFLRSIDSLKGTYIEQYKPANLAQFALDKPQLEISLGTENGNIVLYIGRKKDENSYYMKNKDKDFIYVVDDESVEKLMKKKKDFILGTETSVDASLEDVKKVLEGLPERAGQKSLPPTDPHKGMSSHGGGYH